jgi:hypothetical protein
VACGSKTATGYILTKESKVLTYITVSSSLAYRTLTCHHPNTIFSHLSMNNLLTTTLSQPQPVNLNKPDLTTTLHMVHALHHMSLPCMEKFTQAKIHDKLLIHVFKFRYLQSVGKSCTHYR